MSLTEDMALPTTLTTVTAEPPSTTGDVNRVAGFMPETDRFERWELDIQYAAVTFFLAFSISTDN
jgi:hypothetical protein